MEIIDILKAVTVDCKDNQREFTVKDRINVIGSMLSNSPYQLVNKGKLCLIYAKKTVKNKSVILISSHIDCVYSRLFCEDLNDGHLRGTFDNSLTNSCLLYDMLADRFGDNVAIAFTGDEEESSNGAIEVMRIFRRQNTQIKFCIVLDVTEEGWHERCPFTIENDLGVDIETGYKIISTIKEWGQNYAFVHDAEPDESWDYDEEDIPCLTLCCPIKGDMHSDEGCLTRKELLSVYSEAIVRLSNVVMETTLETKYYIEYTYKNGAYKLNDIHTDEDNCRSDDYVIVMAKDGTLVLPSEIHGKPVSDIEDFWFIGSRPNNEIITVKKLIVPSSYRKLGKKNFSQWTCLEEVVLYCDATAMCEWNFAYCENLRTVRCMNESIYAYCKSLPLDHHYKSYGCFDGILKNVEFKYEMM